MNLNQSSARQVNSSRGSAQGKSKKTLEPQNIDAWADNIHLTTDHLDPDEPAILARNNKMLGEHDKYVEYINHVENAKHNMYARHFEEMQALIAGGQKSNHRYIELTYIVNENEEEVEQRDYTVACKSALSAGIQHG